MAFYSGKTNDMSDMKQVGFYLSEDGKQFSNMPYPITREVQRHLNYTNLTLKEAYELMLKGESKASKRVQKYVKTFNKELLSNQ